MRRNYRARIRVEIKRFWILRRPRSAQGIGRFVTQDEGVGGFLALFHNHIALVVRLPGRIRVAFAHANGGQAGQFNGVGVLGLVQVILRHLAVLHLPNRLLLVIHFGRVVGPDVLHRFAFVVGHNDLGHIVIDRCAIGEVQADGTVRMAGAIGDGHDGEGDQGANLNDVDAHIHRSRAGDAAIGDVSHPQGEYDTEQPHEQRTVICAAEGVRP